MFGKEVSVGGFKYMTMEKGRTEQKKQEVMACRRT